jgi:hypothetical protein
MRRKDPLVAEGDEPARFRREWVARRITEIPHSPWPFGGHPPPDLEQLVATRERRVREQLGSHTRVVIGVGVERRDGMSWSALALCSAISDLALATPAMQLQATAP